MLAKGGGGAKWSALEGIGSRPMSLKSPTARGGGSERPADGQAASQSVCGCAISMLPPLPKEGLSSASLSNLSSSTSPVIRVKDFRLEPHYGVSHFIKRASAFRKWLCVLGNRLRKSRHERRGLLRRSPVRFHSVSLKYLQGFTRRLGVPSEGSDHRGSSG